MSRNLEERIANTEISVAIQLDKVLIFSEQNDIHISSYISTIDLAVNRLYRLRRQLRSYGRQQDLNRSREVFAESF